MMAPGIELPYEIDSKDRMPEEYESRFLLSMAVSCRCRLMALSARERFLLDSATAPDVLVTSREGWITMDSELPPKLSCLFF